VKGERKNKEEKGEKDESGGDDGKVYVVMSDEAEKFGR